MEPPSRRVGLLGFAADSTDRRRVARAAAYRHESQNERLPHRLLRVVAALGEFKPRTRIEVSARGACVIEQTLTTDLWLGYGSSSPSAISRIISLAMARVTLRPFASASRSSAATTPACGPERALDPRRDIGDDARLDLQLAIAEQLEQHGLGQLDVRRLEAHDRRQPQSRQNVRDLQSPGVGTLAGRQEDRCVRLKRRVDEVEQSLLPVADPIGILDQQGAALERSLERSPRPDFRREPSLRRPFSPRSGKVALARRLLAPPGAASCPASPASGRWRSMASRFEAAGRKSSRAKLG